MFLGLETLPSAFSTYCLIRARLAGNKEPVNGQGLANIVVFKIEISYISDGKVGVEELFLTRLVLRNGFSFSFTYYTNQDRARSRR